MDLFYSKFLMNLVHLIISLCIKIGQAKVVAIQVHIDTARFDVITGPHISRQRKIARAFELAFS